MGSGQSEPQSPETPDFIPRSGNRVWRSFVDNISGPGSLRIGAALYHGRNVELGRRLIIAHTDRDENVRIISARKTTHYERKY
jgi:hypothetical protein